MTDEQRVQVNMLRIELIKLLLNPVGFWQVRKARAQKARIAELQTQIALLTKTRPIH